jgi:hypothetical protein
VPANYQLLDVDVQVGERLVVAADGLGPGRRADPERVDVFVCVRIGGGLIVPAIPDLLDELAHLHLASGRIHRSLRSWRRSGTGRSCDAPAGSARQPVAASATGLDARNH